MVPQTKETNPKDALGIAKVPVRSVLPAPVIAEVALAMMEGGLKYGRHNYRESGIRASVYYDALGRHIDAWWEGEDWDPDSLLHHVTKGISTLVVLRDGIIRGKFIDDRPPKTLGFIDACNVKAKALLELYPNPKPAFTHEDVEPTEYRG